MELANSSVSAIQSRTCPGTVPAVSTLWNATNGGSHDFCDSNNTRKVNSAYMGMCRPDLFLLPHPFLCPTLLLFPLIDLRPESDSA